MGKSLGRLGAFLAAAGLFSAAAQNICTLTLVDQSNWYTSQGFYLELANGPYAAPSCQFANLAINLTVGDGTQTQSISSTPVWTLNRNYTATAIVTPTCFELYLDGTLLGHMAAGFSPLPNQNLIAGLPTYMGAGVTNYLAAESALTATSSSGVIASAVFSSAAQPSIPLALLTPGSLAQPTPFVFDPGDTLTFTVVFSLSAAPPQKNYAPYVDAYGQSIYSNYPGKVQTDADLQTAAAEEQTALAAWGTPSGYDAWGGVLNAGWQDTATGFYHVVQHNSVWWLISPDGNPCFYIGVDAAPNPQLNFTPVTGREWEFAALPPQTSPYDAAWSIYDWESPNIDTVSFDTWNAIRKYGSNWSDTVVNLTAQRLQAWGFTGFGKWSNTEPNVPNLPVLENYVAPLVAHPDIWDPVIQQEIATTLQQQMQAQGSINDPRILGWSYDNEYDAIITPGEVQTILTLSSTVPAKRGLVDRALSAIYGNNVAAMAAAWQVTATTTAQLYSAQPTPPAADIETLREYYEDQYLGFAEQTIKGFDPNHLYFGIWIVPGWWVNPIDWKLNAAHADVIGYDRYSPVFEDSLLKSAAKSTGRPIFLGEFSFPPTYNLQRGFGVEPLVYVTDDAAAGAMYQSNMESAARNPWCVGVAWFDYRDQPVSGEGATGETDLDLVEGTNWAFGLVDVTDRPKYDLVNLMRTTNLAMAQRRLAFGPPSLSAGGTVNNASFAANSPVAPGSLVSIFGSDLAGDPALAAGPSLPLMLGTTSLALSGVPVPLMHVFPTQVDAQVPWELAGQTSAPLTIVTDDLSGNTVTVPLVPYSPGIYTATGTGTGQGAILINGTSTLAAPVSGQLVGQPSKRGTDYVDVFATGLGPVTNQPASGAPAPADPLAWTMAAVTVTIGGVPVVPSFAGLAPGWVGLYQVNVEVPPNAPVSDAVPVVVSVGGVTSNQVTMAVQ